MNHGESRAEFYENNPDAQAWAALDDATNQNKATSPGAIRLGRNQYKGKKALILGAGVGGLTTAYELLASKCGMEVTILEAHNRTGGRCLSLRTGDTLVEERNGSLETQTVRFEQPVGDSEPYLNAGPGRIPSSHKHLLGYLKKFGVPIETYVMNTESNLVQMNDGPTGDDSAFAYRRLNHNVRGWVAQLGYEHAETIADELDPDADEETKTARARKIRDLMISFGELIPKGEARGRYEPNPGVKGFENAISRAGFTELPGVEAGKTARPLPLLSLVESEFWKKTRFYQPSDFLWQPTLFQPVGGMDQVQAAFAREVAVLGGNIKLNSPVTRISFENDEFVVEVQEVGAEEPTLYRADYCFSNMAMPFLKDIVCDDLMSRFNADFRDGLEAVFAAQFNDGPVDNKFLANTTKVGWQADRSLWQGADMEVIHCDECNESVQQVPQSEVGVVPIFGGISWTDHEIVQIWYPSNAFHDQLGVLTGAYNFGETAFDWGKKPVKERLKLARKGAEGFGEAFAKGLGKGVAIAWQNIPYIKGGWAQWQALGKPADSVPAFNHLSQGATIDDLEQVRFFVVGDQLSSLPGWQEGAVTSSLRAISRLARCDLEVPHLATLPDTRLMVEGI